MVAADVVVAAAAVEDCRVGEPLAAEIRDGCDRRARDELVVDAVGRRCERDDRLPARDQTIGADMIARDEIDLSVEERRLGDLRAVAILEAHLDAELSPDARLLDDFPDRQMRM
jgi:hypothetical protein